MAIGSVRSWNIIPWILSWETEYKKGHWGDDNYVLTEHDPDDPGGTTKYGIDKRSHPHIDIEHLTKSDAVDIYVDEWKDCGAEKLPLGLGEVYFNATVNAGKGRADKLLALADNDWRTFLNAQESFYRRLASAKPSSQKYLKGWLNRTGDLRDYIQKLLK